MPRRDSAGYGSNYRDEEDNPRDLSDLPLDSTQDYRKVEKALREHVQYLNWGDEAKDFARELSNTYRETIEDKLKGIEDPREQKIEAYAVAKAQASFEKGIDHWIDDDGDEEQSARDLLHFQRKIEQVNEYPLRENPGMSENFLVGDMHAMVDLARDPGATEEQWRELKAQSMDGIIHDIFQLEAASDTLHREGQISYEEKRQLDLVHEYVYANYEKLDEWAQNQSDALKYGFDGGYPTPEDLEKITQGMAERPTDREVDAWSRQYEKAMKHGSAQDFPTPEEAETWVEEIKGALDYVPDLPELMPGAREYETNEMRQQRERYQEHYQKMTEEIEEQLTNETDEQRQFSEKLQEKLTDPLFREGLEEGFERMSQDVERRRQAREQQRLDREQRRQARGQTS